MEIARGRSHSENFDSVQKFRLVENRLINMSTQVCGVLPRRRYTAISVINGAIDSSAVMLLIFKVQCCNVN